MQMSVHIAEIIGGFGTLLVAWLVYQFGKQQAAATNIRLDSQYELDRQVFRMALLDRRLNVLADVRDVSADFMTHARPQEEMLRKLINALQQARLIYHPTLVGDLDAMVTHMLALQRNRVRQKDAIDYYQDNEMRSELIEKQFKIEDELWPILQPLLGKLEEATRVQEPQRAEI